MRDRQDSADPSDHNHAADDWPAWDDADDPDDSDVRQSGAEVAEIISDPTPAATEDSGAPDASGESAAALDAADIAFAVLLSTLRALPGPCAPPVGEGAFDILYASAREIVVWFVSAKDGVPQHEVAIPTRLAREAWEVIRRGAPVDEAALRALAAGAAGGRWLLALFAQLPTVEVRHAAADAEGASQAVTLIWRDGAHAD